MAGDIKFYLDEHIASAVADGLRRRRIDVVTAVVAGMLGASDEEHLEFAKSSNRVLVSFDADFLRLHRSGAVHAGIASGRRPLGVGEIIEGLMLIHGVFDAEEMKGRVEYL